MRLVFECVACGIHYLPPEGMRWGDGTPASPLWCNQDHAAMQAQGITEPPGAVAVALLAARQRGAAPLVEAPVRPDVRPSRPARTRRAASAPGGGRSKLH